MAAWSGSSTDTLITTSNSLEVFLPPKILGTPPQLLTTITTDASGNALSFSGTYTNQIAFTDDGSLAFIAGANGNIYVFDAETQSIVYTLPLQYSGARITSLLVNGGWLYVTEGGLNGPNNGRLLRVNVDQTSADFLNVQQTLTLGVSAPLGFLDMAINSGRYLALTAPAQAIPLTNNNAESQGNVYVIDLAQVGDDGSGVAQAVTTLNTSQLGRLGKGPEYISSGAGVGQFMLSSAKNVDYGLMGITFNTDPTTGNLLGTAQLASTSLTPTAPNWLEQFDQQDIQRSAGTVIVNYTNPYTLQTQTYALVADYNFQFDDGVSSNYNPYGNPYAMNQQIGGKIGIILNPFGTGGTPPVYLGATTPIPGVALNQLSLGADGTLYGTAFVDDTSHQYSPTEIMYGSIFAWNAGALIQAALNAQALGRETTTPIDQYSGNYTTSTQLAGTAPIRFNESAPGQLFGWIEGEGSAPAAEGVQTLGIQFVPFPEQVDGKPVQAVLPGSLQPTSVGSTLQTSMIRLGAEATFIGNAIAGGINVLRGKSDAAQLDAMQEASTALKTVTYNTSNSTFAKLVSAIETVASGFAQLPLQVLDADIAVMNVVSNFFTGNPAIQYPGFSQLAQAYIAGGSALDLVAGVIDEINAINPVSGT